MAAGAVIDIRYWLTRRDLVLAVAAANRFSKLAAVFAALGIVLTAFAISTGDPTWPVPALLGIGFSTGIGPGLISAWAYGRRPEVAQAEVRFEADDKGVRTTTPMTTSTATWALFKRIRETRDAFILDYGSGAGTFVPKAALGADGVAVLRGLASAAGVLALDWSWRLPGIGALVGVAMLAILGALVANGVVVIGAGPV